MIRSERGQAFPAQLARPAKKAKGESSAAQTPLNVRPSGVSIDEGTRAHVHRRIGRQLGKFATQIERVTVRFDDVNGPRGGADKACTIKVVLSHLPSIVVSERGIEAREAFDGAAPKAERAVRSSLGRSKLHARKTRARGERPVRRSAKLKVSEAIEVQGQTEAPEPLEALTQASLAGQSRGRVLAEAAVVTREARRTRGDHPVDTSEPQTSASDRRVGGGHTAARNTKENLAGLTSALEDSMQARPSRKSTRGSAGRAKRDSNLQQRAVRRLRSPKARATRAKHS